MNKKYDAVIVHTGDDCSIYFARETWVYRDLKDIFEDYSKVTVEIKSRRKPRSLPQNKLFHAYCGIIAEETGNSLEVVKSTLKVMFCKKPMLDGDENEIVNRESGEVLYYIQDTRDMSTVEMAGLTENTRLFAAEWFGIILPLPEENIKLNLK